MPHWLVKSEPATWSWLDQMKAPDRTTRWDGVRNAQAAGCLRAMTVGDPVLFYHSGSEKQIVGLARVAKAAYPDPTDKTGRFAAVDLQADRPLPSPVTLSEIKARPELASLALVRQSRLSVMPIDPASWKILCRMGGLKGFS